MNLKSILRVWSIATGIGATGAFGITVATANAAPDACTSSPQACSIMSKASGSGVNLSHHQQKEVKKLAQKAAKGH